MATPTRVLRLTGSYYRNEGVSEEEFHKFMSTDHGVKSAAIHEKYGILRYQLAFGTSNSRALASSLQLPWPLDDHDVVIEYYFTEVAALVGISSDQGFKDLHEEVAPFLKLDSTTIAITWIECYLEDGKVVNIKDGKSLQPSFEKSNNIQMSDQAADKYY